MQGFSNINIVEVISKHSQQESMKQVKIPKELLFCIHSIRGHKLELMRDAVPASCKEVNFLAFVTHTVCIQQML